LKLGRIRVATQDCLLVFVLECLRICRFCVVRTLNIPILPLHRFRSGVGGGDFTRYRFEIQGLSSDFYSLEQDKLKFLERGGLVRLHYLTHLLVDMNARSRRTQTLKCYDSRDTDWPANSMDENPLLEVRH